MEKLKLKEILSCLIAVLILVGVFFLGYFTRSWTSPQSVNSYEWVINLIKNNYFMEIDDEDILNATIEQISANFFDDYSRYYTAEEYRELSASNSGNKKGVGISYEFVDGKGVLVNSVIGSSPAYAAGVRKGMYITSASSSVGTSITFGSLNSFSEYVSGLPDGASVSLYVPANTEQGYAEQTITLTPCEYEASYCYMATNYATYSFSKHKVVESTVEKIDYLPDGCAYLYLSQFYGTAAAEFGALIEKFNQLEMDTLILDLRGNGGGYVDTMIDIAGYFTCARNNCNPYGMIAEYKNERYENYRLPSYALSDKLVSQDTKVYVMANMNTASASEALIGVLVSNGIVDYQDIYLSNYSETYLNYLLSKGASTTKNGKSYGKGVMQTTWVKPDTGEALKLTTARILWPNGKCIDGVGLTESDGCKLSPAEWSVTYQDEELSWTVNDIFSN